jgi:uncharacterized protein YgiM (DUF1202 family)
MLLPKKQKGRILMKKTALILSLTMVTIILMQVSVLAMGLRGYINADQVNLRSAPSASSEVKCVLDQGEKVGYYDRIRDAEGNVWTQAYVSRINMSGYVLAKFVSPAER